MKRCVAVGVALLFTAVGGAQERIAPEEAQKIARLLVEKTANLADAQVKVEADADKPYGLKKDDEGALVIPARGLTDEVLRQAGKDVVPLAQLWVRNLTVVHKDQPVANDKLRVVTINVNDKDHPLPLFLLGVRKGPDGAPELVVFARDKAPLLAVPLKKVDTKQELPVELEARGENDRGVLTLNILGKYQAQLNMAKQEQ